MKPSPDLIQQLPDIDTLVQQLNDSPEAFMGRAIRATNPTWIGQQGEEGEATTLESIRSLEDTAAEPIAAILDEPWFAAGRRGATKIHQNGEDADLQPDEKSALEAIVWLTGRPAILIQNGRFFPPPSEWQVLEQHRNDIELKARSVGRIEVSGHPSLDWVGTGFLIADDVVMTNRHVAEVFCKMGYRRRWKFKEGMSAQIDYIEEIGAAMSAEFELRNVIGIHETLDMALFRVRRTSDSGTAPPVPLRLSGHFPGAGAGRKIYTLGYPAWDGRRNDPEPMLRIFSNIFNVKRLQPGKLQGLTRQLFMHDCSTLGGNSGSCIVDLENNQVIGLHFGGRYLQGNLAVALWQLADDPLLKKAKIEFV